MTGPDDWQELLASVASEALAHQAADAMAVATAVYGGVGLADRLRAAVGAHIAVQTAADDGAAFSGAVADVTRDTVTVGRRIVRVAAISWVRGLPAGHRPPAGEADRALGWSSAVRPLVSQAVEVAAGGDRIRGMLRRVGRDHIEVGDRDGAAVIAATAISWIEPTQGD